MPLPTLASLLALSLTTVALAQDDERDRVIRVDGTTVSGRVVDPFAGDEITLLQAGKRVRIARGDIQRIDSVGDRVQALLRRRIELRGSAKAQEFLIDQAQSDQLPGLARLQALWVVLEQPDNDKARTFLGHHRTSRGWVWPLGKKKVTLAAYEQSLADEPLVLHGERFQLHCNADLKAGVAALFDLEQLGAEWFRVFGRELALHEVLQPIVVQPARNPDEFQKWGFRPIPYYVPAPHGDVARTFFVGAAPTRPERLFFVGTQGLVYRTMIGDLDRGRDNQARMCPWLEIGLGMWMEQSMRGPAGFATFGDVAAKDLLALQALGRDYKLTHLLHLPMYAGFYLADDTATATNWSAAMMFVTWLLDANNPAKTREPFLRFVHEALAQRKGDSSSAFDKTMGARVETFEAPFRSWLAKTAGY